MHRSIDQLTARRHDIVVVGGGIYGLTIACDAAQRGMSVALVEKDDFGSGSSFNHLRTIHGGLRYLQTLDFGRARESIRERRTVARIAPHAVRPLLFALPLYRSLTRGRLAMRAGFLLDALVGHGRNRGLPPALALPRGRVVSRAEAIERFPGLRRQGLTGAATWFDYVTLEPDRLTLSWALAAAKHGAVLANHVEAIAPIKDGPRVVGVRVTDRENGRDVEIAARLVINATGGSVDSLLAPIGLSARVPMLKAMNLVTRRDAGGEALGGRAASGRNLFLVPWRNRALFGTWESSAACAPGDTGVSERDVAAFIQELTQAFPSLDLTTDDVMLVHRGVVPGRMANGGLALEGHEQLRDHSRDGIAGILTIAGTKYTTARAVAERVVDLARQLLGAPPVPCRTASTPLPGGDIGDLDAEIAASRRDHEPLLPSDSIPHLVAAYGTAHRDVVRFAMTRPAWLQRLAADSPVIGGQLAWAVRHEMATTLMDAAVRRTPLGALGYPGDTAAEQAAAIVGDELGWPADRRRLEIDRWRRLYVAGNALGT